MEKYKHCPEFYRAKKKGLLFMIEESKRVIYCGSMLETLRMRAYKKELISYLKKYPTKHLKRSVRKEIREVTSLDIDTTIESVSVPVAAVMASAVTLLSAMARKRRQRKQLRP